METVSFLKNENDESKWHRAAVVGGGRSAAYVYISGYYDAACRLVDIVLQEGSQDTLFYPICFNYRHYIELALKRLIMDAEEFCLIAAQLGATRAVLTESAESKITRMHSLDQLLKWLAERLSLVTETELSADVCRTILEFHTMDPNGQSFRYPFKKDGTLTLPVQQVYDLESIRESMEAVENELSGVEAWLSYHYEQAMEHLLAMQEMAEDFYADSDRFDF